MSKVLEVINEIRAVKPDLMAAQHAASLIMSEIGSEVAQRNLFKVMDERCGTLDRLIKEALDNIYDLDGLPEVSNILMGLSTAESIPLNVGSSVVFEMNSDIDYDVIASGNSGELVRREGFFSFFTVLDIEAEGIDLNDAEPAFEALEVCMPLLERHMDPEDRFIPLSRMDLASIQPGLWVPLPRRHNPAIKDIWMPPQDGAD